MNEMRRLINLVESAQHEQLDEGAKMGLAVGASSANIGAMIGTAVFPGVGTTIGAILGGAYGFGLGRQINDWEDIKIWFKSAGQTLNKEERAQKILAKGKSEFDRLNESWLAVQTSVKKALDTTIPEMIKLVKFNQFEEASKLYAPLRGTLYALRTWDIDGFDVLKVKTQTDKIKQKLGIWTTNATENDKDYLVDVLESLWVELSELDFNELPNDIKELMPK